MKGCLITKTGELTVKTETEIHELTGNIETETETERKRNKNRKTERQRQRDRGVN